MKKMMTVIIGIVLTANTVFTYTKSTHMVKMRDGINLETDVYLPEGLDSTSVPAVLIRTPYGRERQKPELIAAFTDSSSYALVIQDTRGQHSSEGIDSVFLDDAWGDKKDGY
ncbi:hypothetical protein GF359_02505, partial [candidate division WOR-3 bacterium]|nr:hypothetical protein [candidate division WOR-3 bacterium]MBD3364065.1 hypothetical protein [candidate division WOR-3 bacterium]